MSVSVSFTLGFDLDDKAWRYATLDYRGATKESVHISQVLSEATHVVPDGPAKSKTPHIWLIITTAVVLAVLFGLLVWCLLCPHTRGQATDYMEADKTMRTFIDQSTPADRTNTQQDRDRSKSIVVLEDNKL